MIRRHDIAIAGTRGPWLPGLTGRAAAVLLACSGAVASAAPPMTISALTTDRAAYAPGMPVRVSVEVLAGKGADPGPATVSLRVRHLETVLPTVVQARLTPRSGGLATVELQWQPPNKDFQGYAIDVTLADAAGRVLDRRSSAVDVSSSWTRFPRYGYLTDYSPSQDPRGVMKQLDAWHLNALQYYDWQWKHHFPVKGSPSHPDARWQELSTRTVDKSVLTALIDEGHRRGIVAMQYNLIYGAADDFAKDGVDARWGLFDAPGGAQWKLDMPAGWNTSALYLFNPADAGWRNYLLDREMEVFEAFDFDGWHADTIGIPPDAKFDAAGRPVDLASTFGPFLRAAKQRLGSKYLVMNAVGTKGHLEVNSSPVDVIYMEIWPDDGVADYRTLKDTIDQARQESSGKSLVVPTYSNKGYAEHHTDQAPGQFNEPGVLLTEATVLAAGGSRLEIGEGSRMLCHPYFPNRSLVMSDALRSKMRHYYDFMVAYENLLRDGQENAAHRIELPGVASSDAGQRNAVWTFAKQDARHEVVHFINLVGARHTFWQDNDATQSVPTPQSDVPVKYYTSSRPKTILVASPDFDGGRPTEIPVVQGSDGNGAFLRFTLPRLDYWTMAFLPRDPARR